MEHHHVIFFSPRKSILRSQEPASCPWKQWKQKRRSSDTLPASNTGHGQTNWSEWMKLCVTAEGSSHVNATLFFSSSKWTKKSNKMNLISLLPHLIILVRVFLSRHEKATAVYRGGGGEIVARAHRGVQGSIPVSRTFIARVFECVRRIWNYSSEESGQSFWNDGVTTAKREFTLVCLSQNLCCWKGKCILWKLFDVENLVISIKF